MLHDQERPQRTILVIDDEEMILSVLEMYLTSLHVRCLTAPTAARALSIARGREAIDLAILDLNMPLTPGTELFRALRAARPGIKVIITSGSGPNDEADQLLAAGAAGFLAKPFSLTDVERALRAALP